MIPVSDRQTDRQTDVSLADPWCLDSVKAGSREEGVAAMKREKKKEAKYNSELLPEGSCPLVIPRCRTFWPLGRTSS